MNVQAVVYTNERGQDLEQAPWPLPAGWTWVSLDDLGHWTGGGTPSKTVPSFWTDGTIPWVSPKDMKLDVIGATEDLITEEALDRSATKLVPADSVLMVMRSGILRHSFPVARTDRPVTLNQDLRALTPIDALDSSYLARYLARSARAVLNACSKDGTTVNSIDAKSLGRFRVPVPPLAEQRRIVARIDALFEEIAEGERALDAGRKSLETYRRALLKAAVTGELTSEWRSHYDDATSAADLLARLRSRYPAERPTVTRWSAPASLPDIPDSWTWCAVAEAGEVQLGRQRAPQHHAGDHMRPYLRVANVLEDHFDLTDVKAMNFTPAEFATFELRAGDILLNEGQAPDLLGRSAIYNGEIPGCCFQKTLLRFRAKEGVNPAYAQLIFRHYMHSGRFKRESRITTNIGHLTQVRFVVMEFPLPPSLEQDAIVSLFGELDVALRELDPIAADAVRLRQSVLKAAFEGRLVPQDESDEPAATMLARLAALQAKTPRPHRGRPRAVTP